MEEQEVKKIEIDDRFVPMILRVQPKLAGIDMSKYGYWSFGWIKEYDEMMGRTYSKKVGSFLCRKDLIEELTKTINETRFLSRATIDSIDRVCKKLKIYKIFNTDKESILVAMYKKLSGKEINDSNLREALSEIIDELKAIRNKTE